jgi:hypothetical protein
MKSVCLLSLLFAALWSPVTANAQQKKTPPVNRSPQLVRTTMRHEVRRFGYGGTLTLIGAPEGSVTIEGWTRNEIDISAEIQLRADTEADLDLLAALNTMTLIDDANHLQILSPGTHDKVYLRTVAKKFPKTLLGLPWKIDYKIRVPISIDLDVSTGRGPVSITGVEGNIQLTASESEANLNLSGGTLSATIAVGKLKLSIPTRSWRGNGVDLRVALGELTVELPPGFSGDIDADILRSGRVEDSYGLAARDTRGVAGPNQLRASAGAGGTSFQLTVGDGVIYIKKQTEESKQ